MTHAVPEIQHASRIPPLPPRIRKLVRSCEGNEGRADEVTERLKQDPSLCERSLQGLNLLHGSAHASIAEAVEAHGAKDAVRIALCASVYDRFHGGLEARSEIIDPRSFWWHALQCGTLARLLAQKTGHGSPEEAFAAGFLHDIGKVILLWCLPDAYKALIRDAGDRRDLLLEGERRLGGTHPHVGAWMAQRWGLPPLTADAIRYHHEPRERILGALPLVRIVFAAHELCSRDPKEEPADGANGDRLLGLSVEERSKLSLQAEELVRKVATALEMEAAPPSGDEILSGRDLEKELLPTALRSLLRAGSPEEVCRVAGREIHRILGLKQVLFFVEDSSRGGLAAFGSGSDHGHPRREDMVAPFEAGNSLIIRAFLEQAPLDSFSSMPAEGAALLDEQVCHWLGTDGLLALPLCGAAEPLGTVVIGLGESQLYDVFEQQHLLDLLVLQAGFVLEAGMLRTGGASVRSAVPSQENLHDLARKVVHEANGPLGIIKNYLKILDRKLAGHQVARDEIRILNEEIDRVAQILDRFRAMTDEATVKAESLDLNSLIFDLTRIMKDSLVGSGARLHIELDPTIPPVLADRDRLKQVLINLIHNGMEALGEGGNLYVRTESPPRAETVSGQGEDKDRNRVTVTVSDDGPGVPAEIRDRLFQPFQGTKGQGHAGLGLSIVKELIDAMGGTIRYADRDQGGASFSFSIPEHRETPPGSRRKA